MSADDDTISQAMDNGCDGRKLLRLSMLNQVTSTIAFYIFAVDVVLVIGFTMLSANHVFWSLQNAQALMGNGAEAVLLASGVTIMLAAGVFDLSLGGNLILTSVVGAEGRRCWHGHRRRGPQPGRGRRHRNPRPEGSPLARGPPGGAQGDSVPRPARPSSPVTRAGFRVIRPSAQARRRVRPRGQYFWMRAGD
jgi:hypothetical protein